MKQILISPKLTVKRFQRRGETHIQKQITVYSPLKSNNDIGKQQTHKL